MPLTLEDINGGPLASLEEAVRARVGFPIVKHGLDDTVDEAIDRMTNSELLSAISTGIDDLRERRKLALLGIFRDGESAA